MIPWTATKCTQLLTGVYSDYNMTMFPNSFDDTSSFDARTRFDNLPMSVTNCNANAELFFCAQLFRDCPDRGWTRRPCRQLCQAVRYDCEAAYNAVFPDDPWAWDCNDFHDGASDELCLHPEGGKVKNGFKQSNKLI